MNAFLVACLAVSAMVAYAFLAYFVPNVRLRPDKLGDNLYYMGFVFTLASMSAALIQLQSDPENISNIIGGFGIALFTTIAGIAGRVTLLQLRTEVEDVEESTRRDLMDHAQRLRGQLSAAIGDLEVFRLGVRQAVEERLRESIVGHQSLIDQQMSNLGSTMSAASASLGDISKLHLDLLARMRDAMTGSVDELQALRKRLAAVRIPTDLIERRLEGVMAKIDATVGALEAATKGEAARNESLSAATRQLEAVGKQLNIELLRAQDATSQLGAASAPATALCAQVLDLSQRLEEVGQALSSSSTTVSSAAELSQQNQQALAQIVAASTSDAEQLRSSYNEAATLLIQATRDIVHQLQLRSAVAPTDGEIAATFTVDQSSSPSGASLPDAIDASRTNK